MLDTPVFASAAVAAPHRLASEAGRKGSITIATNMAGRGVDILLGGRVADAVV